MTRLTTAMINNLSNNLCCYDELIKLQTGYGLLDLSLITANLSKDRFYKEANKLLVAVVPTTVGEGRISKFSETVSSILEFVGLKAFVTTNEDITGIGEAFSRKADIIFSADDHEFIAISRISGKIVYNSVSTAEVFVTALEKACGGLSNKDVLVIGTGKVGKIAISSLSKKRAKIHLYDKDFEKLDTIAKRFNTLAYKSWQEVPRNFNLIYDASPGSELIDEEFINEDTFISCPGVPHGLTNLAKEKILRKNFIHDNLILGVLTMATSLIQKIP